MSSFSYSKHERAANDIPVMIHGLSQIADDVRQHNGSDDDLARRAELIADELVILIRTMGGRCQTEWPDQFDRADLDD